ncbi:MAG: helix-turn-helix domain-containing protein, partial [Spirochaetota bacterium]
LEIPAHHLSIVVNRHLDKNFYGFINEYRIKNAKAMLADQAYSSYTVLNIALDSGFNSKSAFNNIFKQSTGLTPTEYRKKQPEAS